MTTTDGQLCIDKKLTENAVRPFVMGRNYDNVCIKEKLGSSPTQWPEQTPVTIYTVLWKPPQPTVMNPMLTYAYAYITRVLTELPSPNTLDH